MQTLWQDLRYALRLLRRAPGFTVTALLALSFTVEHPATVLSVFDALLIRPLPFGQPASSPEYDYWRMQIHSLRALAGYSAQVVNFSGPAGPVGISASTSVERSCACRTYDHSHLCARTALHANPAYLPREEQV